MSAQTRQTTLSGDVTESSGYSPGDLSGLAHCVWAAGVAAPDGASDRDVATVALDVFENDTDVGTAWRRYQENDR